MTLLVEMVILKSLASSHKMIPIILITTGSSGTI